MVQVGQIVELHAQQGFQVHILKNRSWPPVLSHGMLLLLTNANPSKNSVETVRRIS